MEVIVGWREVSGSEVSWSKFKTCNPYHIWMSMFRGEASVFKSITKDSMDREPKMLISASKVHK